MAFFTNKNWLNRVSQFPTRRRLTITSSSASEMVVTVARDEGTVSQAGDAFSAANMNGLESRLLSAFNSVDNAINTRTIPATVYNNNVKLNGCKNLLVMDPSIDAYSQTKNDVIWTINTDGTIKAKCVESTHQESILDLAKFTLKAGTYVLSGCPSGGGDTTYKLNILKASDNSAITNDKGSTGVFTLNSDTKIVVKVRVAEDEVLSDAITFYPMISLKTDYDLDSSYVPGSMSNSRITTDMVSGDLLSEVGAVNYLNVSASTQTINGITWTVNSDKSIVASESGTMSSDSIINLNGNGQTLKAGTYKLTGCPTGGAAANYYMGITIVSGSMSTTLAEDKGNGVVFTLLTDSVVIVKARIVHTYSMSGNLRFYPMITPANYNGNYAPYVKTNKKLMEDIATNADSIASVKSGILRLKSYNNEQQLSQNTIYTIPDMNGVYLVFFTKTGSNSNCGVYLTQCHSNGNSSSIVPLAAVTASNFSLSFNGTSLVVATGSAEPRVRFMQITNSNY